MTPLTCGVGSGSPSAQSVLVTVKRGHLREEVVGVGRRRPVGHGGRLLGLGGGRPRSGRLGTRPAVAPYGSRAAPARGSRHATSGDPTELAEHRCAGSVAYRA